MSSSLRRILIPILPLGFFLFVGLNLISIDHPAWSLTNQSVGAYLEEFPEFPWDYPWLQQMDGMYWTDYAMRMVEEGRWRIRFTEIDNAPWGREVHWASLNIWWLVLLGGIAAVLTGQTWIEGIALATPWSNPILMVIGMPLLAWVVARRFGWLNALVFLLISQWFIKYYLHFPLGDPDHHGWQVLMLGFYLVYLLGLVCGARPEERTPGVSSAGAIATEAALCGFTGGCLLWVGATQGAVILALSGGAIAATLLFQRFSPGSPPPQLPAVTWLIWGFTGGLTSLVFYLLEYAPNHFSMHLEVNHPLYACSYAAGGMLLFATQLLLFPGDQRDRLRPALLFAASLGLALFPAILILTSPPGTFHAMTEPTMKRLHDFLHEFQGVFSHDTSFITVRELLLLLVLELFAVIMVFWRSRNATPEQWRSIVGLGMVSLIALGLLVVTVLQERWFSLAVMSGLMTLVMLLNLPRKPGALPIGKLLTGWAVLVLANHSVTLIALSSNNIEGKVQIAINDFHGLVRAHRAVQESLPPGREEAVVLQYPLRTGGFSLIGFTEGIQVVPSQYWENLEGNRDAFGVLGSLDPAVSRDLVRRRGVTHIIISNRQSAVIGPMYFWNDDYLDLEERQKLLAFKLAAPRADPPDWLSLIDEVPIRKGEYFRIYRVNPDILAQWKD